jgi:hypothetical protein
MRFGSEISATDLIVGTDAVYAGPLRQAALAFNMPINAPNVWTRIPLDGSPVSHFDAPAADAFAADDQSLYLVFDGDMNVKAMPNTGGELRVVASLADAAAVTVDANFLYVAQQSPTNRIVKLPRSGGATTTIADHAGNPTSIAVDDDYIYWSATDDGAIRRAPK